MDDDEDRPLTLEDVTDAITGVVVVAALLALKVWLFWHFVIRH